LTVETKDKELQSIFKRIPSKLNAKEGDIVYGKVVQTTDKVAIIELNYSDKNKAFSPSQTGVLFINNISDDYLEKLSDAVRKGDVIKAKVHEADKFGFKITINEPGLGVIRANCYKCKQSLNLEDKELRCSNCKTTQTRKIGKM